jgi:hypothetical protein
MVHGEMNSLVLFENNTLKTHDKTTVHPLEHDTTLKVNSHKASNVRNGCMNFLSVSKSIEIVLLLLLLPNTDHLQQQSYT